MITLTAVYLHYVYLALLRRAYGWETESRISGSLKESKTEADSLVEEQLGKLDEKEEPATERMREYIH